MLPLSSWMICLERPNVLPAFTGCLSLLNRLLWRKRCAVGIWLNMSAEWLRWERQRENEYGLELSNANRGGQEREINGEDELPVAVLRNNWAIKEKCFAGKSDWIVEWRVSCRMHVLAIRREDACGQIYHGRLVTWHVQNYNCQGVGYISSCTAVFAKWSVLMSNLLLSRMTCLVIYFYLITLFTAKFSKLFELLLVVINLLATWCRYMKNILLS